MPKTTDHGSEKLRGVVGRGSVKVDRLPHHHLDGLPSAESDEIACGPDAMRRGRLSTYNERREVVMQEPSDEVEEHEQHVDLLTVDK